MQLDIKKGTAGVIEAYQGDSIEDEKIITLINDDKLFDLTGFTCDLAYVDTNSNYADVVGNLNIISTTAGQIELPINANITKRTGVYNCELRLKDKDGNNRYTAFFSLVVKENVFSKAAPFIENSTSFKILQDLLDKADSYNQELKNATNGLELKYANELNVLDSRMNNFATLKNGSTTGDAELTDIRVGADGTKYDSAGEAVRGQIENINGLYIKVATIDNNATDAVTNSFQLAINKLINTTCIAKVDLPDTQNKKISLLVIDKNGKILERNNIVTISKNNKAFIDLRKYNNLSNEVYIGFDYEKGSTLYYKNYSKEEKEKLKINIYEATTIQGNSFNVGDTVTFNFSPDIWQSYKIGIDIIDFGITKETTNAIINNIAETEKEIKMQYTNFETLDENANTIVSNGYKIAINKALNSNAIAKINVDGKQGDKVTLLILDTNKKILIKKEIMLPFKEFVDLRQYSDLTNAVYIGFDYPVGSTLYYKNYSKEEKEKLKINIYEATTIQGNSFNVGDTVTFNFSPDIWQSYKIGIDIIDYGALSSGRQHPQNVITVGEESCDYKTINEAIKNANDSAENPITILIYPGIYEEVCRIGAQRHLSLIGVNREQCIIKDTSGRYDNSPVRISGDFTLENLTIIATAENVDPSWTPKGYQPNSTPPLDYPSYAIHIDDYQGTDENGKDRVVHGYIRNCTFYSECFHAAGIGLHNNQTLTIENCTIERNTTRQDFLDNGYQGAFGVHSTLVQNEEPQTFIMKNCEVKYNNEKAAQLYHYNKGSLLKTTFINCTLEDKNGVNNVVYLKGEDNLIEQYITKTSHGNSTNELNAN